MTSDFEKQIVLRASRLKDADHTWPIGITEKGVRCADIEWGNIYDHENLKSDNFIELIATTNHDYDDHNTRVTGVIFTRDNGLE